MTNTQQELTWLSEAATLFISEWLTPRGFDVNGYTGEPLYNDLNVSRGYPPTNAIGNRGRVIGVCISPEASNKGLTEIFVSPFIFEGLDVLEVMSHELGHAVLGGDPKAVGHGPAFLKYSQAIGMDGTWANDHANPELRQYLQTIIDRIGPYPHAGIDLTKQSRPPKAATRMLKVYCDNPLCGYAIKTGKVYMMRTTWSVLRDGGNPLCGTCEQRMIVILPRAQITDGNGSTEGPIDPDAPPVLADGNGNGKPEPIPPNVRVTSEDASKNGKTSKPGPSEADEPADDDFEEPEGPDEEEAGESTPVVNTQPSKPSPTTKAKGFKATAARCPESPHPVDMQGDCPTCVAEREALEV